MFFICYRSISSNPNLKIEKKERFKSRKKRSEAKIEMKLRIKKRLTYGNRHLMNKKTK